MWARLLLALVISGFSPAARAVPLVSVEFDITGGSFASSTGFAQGPITGGTIRWVADGGMVETPTTRPMGRFTQFSLTGPSGFFAFEVPIHANSGTLATSSIFLSGFGGPQPSAIRSGASHAAAALFPVSNYVAPFVCAGAAQTPTSFRCGTPFQGEARGSLGVSGTNRPFGHFFTVGAEVVRTVVPEPGTGLLLGLSLIVLGALPCRVDRGPARPPT